MSYHFRGVSKFIRLLSFFEKLPALQFCAYSFPLPVLHYRKHLKPVALSGGLFDTDAAAFSFVHENKHPLRCKLEHHALLGFALCPCLLWS